MATPAARLDKRGETIRQMFAGVAPRYDLLNHLLSASMDRRWRTLSARALAPRDGDLILDLCCGTGDQALTISPVGARVVAADFCLPMLVLAQDKFDNSVPPQPRGMASDALALPYPNAVFDGAVVSFGLRNVADLDAALRELERILKPDGRLSILEFMAPVTQPLRAAYLFYFRRILPLIGRLVSPRGSAYSYLPASVLEFPQREAFLERMRSAGFKRAECRSLTGGIVGLYTGVKLG
jgi:demethylmenaquinone methyltransferase/2-methoxy-6-polyprenyl-1,4-benzoquinol methylase